uniref:Uncharacterized protein n=1 Tax=Panagrolaimus superbus TaxID=310955 RepID=A0A914ZCN9_9BILA
MSLRDAFIGVIIDHSKLYDDYIFPVGANCTMEGPLSDPFFSSQYASTSSSFPCYRYYEISHRQQIYPIMGINVIPITNIAKGKHCYYYTIKMGKEHEKTCSYMLRPIHYAPVMTIAACPENVEYDKKEFDRVLNVTSACPTMKSGESKWKYITTIRGNGILCGQFLRGLKLQDGIYVPEEIELRGGTWMWL